MEGEGVGFAITTLDKKACEGLAWVYAMHPCQNHGVRLRLRLRARVRFQFGIKNNPLGVQS